MSDTATMPFTAIFWNVWVNSQLTAAKVQALCTRFDELIARYKPDVFGINEVLSHSGTARPPLLEHLESRGYHTFFAPFSPEKTGHFSGSALASRAEPLEVAYHELGPDKYGARRGYPGNTIKLIRAQLQHGGQPVNVVVNYLAHLAPYNWTAHIKHHKAFRAVMKLPALQSGTIIGGDFNQFKFMPRLWSARSVYERATGTLFHPTWKLGGKIPLIQANYDNIFWSKRSTLNLKEFRVLKRTPSDHAPLVAKFIVN